MEREAWIEKRTRSMADVLGSLRGTCPEVFEHDGQPLPPLRVVGRWLWCYFQVKPSDKTRAALKAEGFAWSKRHEAWAHPCGVFTTRGKGDPRWKYGEIGADEIAERVGAGA